MYYTMTQPEPTSFGKRMKFAVCSLALATAVAVTPRDSKAVFGIPVADYITELYEIIGYVLQGYQLYQEIDTAAAELQNIVNWDPGRLLRFAGVSEDQIQKIQDAMDNARAVTYTIQNPPRSMDELAWRIGEFDPKRYMEMYDKWTKNAYQVNRQTLAVGKTQSESLQEDMRNVQEIANAASDAEGNLEISKAGTSAGVEIAKGINNLRSLQITAMNQNQAHNSWVEQQDEFLRKYEVAMADESRERDTCWFGRSATCSSRGHVVVHGHRTGD